MPARIASPRHADPVRRWTLTPSSELSRSGDEIIGTEKVGRLPALRAHDDPGEMGDAEAGVPGDSC